MIIVFVKDSLVLENVLNMLLTLLQFDRKIISQLSGLGGAFCTMCTASRADGHDVALIEAGFCIDRNMEDIHALFYLLAEMDDLGGESVIKSDGDYEWRTDLTSRPLTKLDMTTVLPPLHAKLRILGMLLQLCYRYSWQPWRKHRQQLWCKWQRWSKYRWHQWIKYRRHLWYKYRCQL